MQLESSGKWKKHCEKILKNVNFAYWKTYRYICDFEVLILARLRAFSALIKPLFDYASEIWNPSLTDKNRMMQVFDKILHRVSNCNKYTNIFSIFKFSRLKPFTFYWTYLKMLFKYSIAHQVQDCVFEKFR